MGKVSVIIVSYNVAEYISQAIESCLEQHYEDLEIIIGDDGSNDSSLQIISDYENAYGSKIKYFVMERPTIETDIIPALRVSNILRRGSSIATGEYILCLAGDDYLCDKNKLSEAVGFLREHPEYSAFVSGFKKVWPDGKEQIVVPRMPDKLFWAVGYLHVSSFVFRKEVMDSYLLNRLCDDTGMIYSILRAGRCRYSSNISIAYRQRAGSIMHKAKQMELDILELMLLQDVLNARDKKMYFSSLSRCSFPLLRVFKNKKKLTQYKKYLVNCSEYENDILGELMRFEELSFYRKAKMEWLIIQSVLGRIIFVLIQVFYYLGARVRSCLFD